MLTYDGLQGEFWKCLHELLITVRLSMATRDKIIYIVTGVGSWQFIYRKIDLICPFTK